VIYAIHPDLQFASAQDVFSFGSVKENLSLFQAAHAPSQIKNVIQAKAFCFKSGTY